MGLETIAGLGLGALGLFQNQHAQDRQNSQINDANALNWDALNFQKDNYNKYTAPALQSLLGLASNYDPTGEAKFATDYASRVANDSLGRALRGFNTNYIANGGTPGNSSIYGAQQASTMRPIAQQLAGIVADAQANSTAKKAQMWQTLLGAAPPGQLSQSYFQAAGNMANLAQQMGGGDSSGSALMLSNALSQLFKHTNSPGAGGSGDFRYNDPLLGGGGGFGNSGFGTFGGN